jgi:RimJ/RimL family protein N-acetyltransferase
VPREEAWRRLLSAAGFWPLLGYGYWSAVLKADGSFVGQLGFGDMKREESLGIADLPEIGWLFSGQARGRGIATEAVAAVLDWGRTSLHAKQVVALIGMANAPSRRVAEKLGFDVHDEAVLQGEPLRLCRLELSQSRLSS